MAKKATVKAASKGTKKKAGKKTRGGKASRSKKLGKGGGGSSEK